MLERKRCAVALLEWRREPAEHPVTFLSWLPLDIKSFLVCSNIEVRTLVLCFSRNLTNEMWQQTQTEQLSKNNLLAHEALLKKPGHAAFRNS